MRLVLGVFLLGSTCLWATPVMSTDSFSIGMNSAIRGEDMEIPTHATGSEASARHAEDEVSNDGVAMGMFTGDLDDSSMRGPSGRGGAGAQEVERNEDDKGDHSSVPEPSSLGLVLLAGAALAFLRLRQRSTV